jgi:hypothetical protein
VGFLVLKNSILALSRVLPGRACGELIEEACPHLADAYEPHVPDTTALALAIAWWRCAKAVGP